MDVKASYDFRPVRGADYWIAGLLFCLAYLLTLAVNHSEGEDSLGLVMSIIRFADGKISHLFNPNHLFFLPVNLIFYSLITSIGMSVTPVVTMQILNVIAAVSALLLIIAITRMMGIPRFWSILASVFVGSSYGFWQYSVEAETYILPLPMFLLAVMQFYKCMVSEYKIKYAVGVGVFASLAVLLHQQYVFLAITLWLALLVQHRNDRQIVPTLFWSALAMVVVIGAPYLIVASKIHDIHTFMDAVNWSRGLASSGLWIEPGFSTLPKAAAGLGRTVYGMDFLFAFDSIYNTLTHLFPTKSLVEERFLAEGVLPAVRWACLLLLCLSMVSLFSLAALVRWRSMDISPLQRSMNYLFMAIVIVVAVTTTLWEPQNIEFWIPVLPFSAMSVALILSCLRVNRGYALLVSCIMVSSLFLSNLLGSVYPKTQYDLDFWYQAQRPAINNLERGDLIWTEGGYIGNRYLLFYSPKAILVTADDTAQFETYLRDPNFKGNIYVSSWVKAPMETILKSGRKAKPRHRTDLEQARKIEDLADSISGHLELVEENQWQAVYRYQKE